MLKLCSILDAKRSFASLAQKNFRSSCAALDKTSDASFVRQPPLSWRAASQHTILDLALGPVIHMASQRLNDGGLSEQSMDISICAAQCRVSIDPQDNL